MILSPFIWDKKNKNFKDSSKKDTSWEEIGDIMNLSGNNLLIKFHKNYFSNIYN